MASPRSPDSYGAFSVGMGIVGALAAALAGMADYSEVESPQRREATAHALVNIAGTLAVGFSLLLRFRGSWKLAIPFSTVGYALIVVGSDLGGRLVFNLGTLVSREAFSSPPEKFTQVLAVAEMEEGRLKKVDAKGHGHSPRPSRRPVVRNWRHLHPLGLLARRWQTERYFSRVPVPWLQIRSARRVGSPGASQ
jgi:hypothetical protein